MCVCVCVFSSCLPAFQADNGDAVSRSILEDAADQLVVHIVNVCTKLGLPQPADRPLTVVLAGSVHAQPIMLSLIIPRLQKRLPAARAVLPSVDASVGAALLALHAQTPQPARSSHDEAKL